MALQLIHHLQAQVQQLPKVASLRLENSALPGTACNVSLSLHLTKVLKEALGPALNIFSIDATAEELEAVLAAVLPPLAKPAIVDQHLTAAELRRLLLHNRKDVLVQLIRWFDACVLTEEVKESLWQKLKVYVRFVVPSADPQHDGLFDPTYIQTGRLKKPIRVRITAGPMLREEKLSAAQRAALLLRARLALAARQRETDPITYADERCVRMFRADRGFYIALFSMLPVFRLPLETYVGYLIFKHGLPIAYGGCWMFHFRARTGIHVFEEFRGGESLYAFAQVLRLYHQCFGITQFFADSFQLGKNNEEGIRSGAYWFYHRLGFRPVDQRLRKQAEREAQLLKKQPGHRTPDSLLRAFAAGPVELLLDRKKTSPDPLCISEYFLKCWLKGSFHYRLFSLIDFVNVSVGIRELHYWSADERHAVLKLIPLLHVTEWSGFSQKDRRQILNLLRMKGGADETAFVRATQKSEVWERWLMALTVRRSDGLA
ncbi:MAG: hypothetical protein NZL95_02445 [Chitinophagales bacterium]|nr:hypothetical protein [Chitinophagales bacterium]MDW8427393.1 hypothetical protein [Chitinophagales bacterium]